MANSLARRSSAMSWLVGSQGWHQQLTAHQCCRCCGIQALTGSRKVCSSSTLVALNLTGSR